MKSFTKALLSLILVVCLLASTIGFVIPATAAETSTTTNLSANTPPPTTSQVFGESIPEYDITLIHEETSLRGAFEKHFLMSDGSYQAVLYNEPVHKIEDGKWVEIDNTLNLRTTADGFEQYSTVNGLTDISFSKSFEEKLVTLRQDNHCISWGVQAISTSSNQLSAESIALHQPVQAEPIINNSTEETQLLSAEKSTSAIQYRNALRENVDLEYIVLPSHVKENIILHSPQDINHYIVTVHTQNLSARLLENRQVEFFNTNGEVIFTMSSPYMYDSATALSEEIEVDMIPKGNGCYIIKMTPDAQWLHDESRVYPIVIDPNVSVNNSQQNIVDTYVLEGSGVQNSSLDRLYIGLKSGSRARAFIKYNTMPTLPSGSTISAATMSLQILSGTSTANNASAYMVTGTDWSAGTITWAGQPAASTLLASNISHNTKTRYSFSVKTAAQSWYSGSTSGKNKNYGIMLRYYSETINDYNSVYSADYSDAAKRPALTITYQPPSTSASVVEGSTYTLTAPNVTGTITWASSNTSVATVNSSGKVTGIKAGQTTITASVGGTVQKTYTIYVRIADGVYRIKSTHLGLYLGTYGQLSDNTSAKLLSYSSDATTQLYQLWKITHLSYGYYSIRPLYKLDMALHTSSNSVDITNTGKDDYYSTVASLNRWTIVHSTSGYTINNNGTASRAMKPADGSASPGASVVIAPKGTDATNFQWTFHRVSNPPSGILLYELSSGKRINLTCSRYIADDTTKTMAELDFAAYAYSGNAATTEKITWSRQSGASCLSIGSSTGTVTATSPGTALITGHSSYGTFQLYVTVTGQSSADYTFVNQYDVSFTEDPELVGFIDDAVSFVNAAYQNQFSISFTSSTTPYYRAESITDDCPLPFYESCHSSNQCGDSCNTSHHKNLYRISNHFYSSTIPQNQVVVFWTDGDGITYCLDGQYAIDAFDNPVTGLVYEHRPVIHLMTIEDEVQYRMQCMATNLGHEFSHTLGMDDYYDDPPHSDGDWHCVMDVYNPYNLDGLNNFYWSVLYGDANLFCSSCEAEMDALLASSS